MPFSSTCSSVGRQSGDEVGSVEPPEAEASTTSCHDGGVAGILSHGGTEHGKKMEQDGNIMRNRIHVWYINANIWGILMVNVTIYSIHGSYGWEIVASCGRETWEHLPENNEDQVTRKVFEEVPGDSPKNSFFRPWLFRWHMYRIQVHGGSEVNLSTHFSICCWWCCNGMTSATMIASYCLPPPVFLIAQKPSNCAAACYQTQKPSYPSAVVKETRRRLPLFGGCSAVSSLWRNWTGGARNTASWKGNEVLPAASFGTRRHVWSMQSSKKYSAYACALAARHTLQNRVKTFSWKHSMWSMYINVSSLFILEARYFKLNTHRIHVWYKS